MKGRGEGGKRDRELKKSSGEDMKGQGKEEVSEGRDRGKRKRKLKKESSGEEVKGGG